MDRQSHDYAAASAMAYAQQQQQFGFHPQHQHQQQFAPPPSYMSPHPPMQQFPYPPRYPPPPHHHHHQQQHLLQQQHFPPLNLPPHGYPSVRGPYDAPPPPPPSDPELQKRIEKLVEYAAKNGPEFEAMIREKQQDNPGYSFLFGGEGHTYYRYKLWMSTHPPFNAPFPPPMVVAAAPPPPPPSPFYDPPRPSHPFALPARPESKPFVSPLPPGVSLELANVLNTLNGTKESIKGAKTWFLQRSPFAPALAQALRDWVFSLDDSHTQLHAIYLANDILLDSLQRRASTHELDNEAFAFKPVLGSMLARAYHNPQNKDENQPQLQKILQFWASMKVYDQDTIYALESEMVGGPPTNSFPGPPKELSTGSDTLAAAGFTQPSTSHAASQWQADRQSIMDQEHPDKQIPHAMPPSLGTHQFLPNSVSGGAFPGSMTITSSVQSINQQPAPHSVQAPPANVSDKLPPYPLFPPGLIPGMVKKTQIGSGVPYSPLSPLDIPTVIPPSNVSPSETLERVSKFFKEIGEVNPMEGSVNSQLQDEDDEYGRDTPIRKGGACIPPPLNLQVDPETGTYADGSVERKPGSTGSARLGLGATADPNEASQYDDVYTSYRKQRSTTYHSSMSSRAATR